MAGAETETALLGGAANGDGQDRYEIEMLAESDYANFSADAWTRFEPRMRRQTRRLVRRHRDKIHRVAQALLDRKVLTEEEIDALIS
jgi:ATP-dependent Zn protease